MTILVRVKHATWHVDLEVTTPDKTLRQTALAVSKTLRKQGVVHEITGKNNIIIQAS